MTATSIAAATAVEAASATSTAVAPAISAATRSAHTWLRAVISRRVVLRSLHEGSRLTRHLFAGDEILQVRLRVENDSCFVTRCRVVRHRRWVWSVGGWMADFDLAVIGGGIVGLSTAMQMTERFPGISVAVLEKEPALARHQTGRNSGVIHAGVYYQPGSLKAQFCREGADATTRFCRDQGIAYEQCGKLLVATEPAELPRMEELYERARANGIDVERLDKAEVARREPRIRGLGGLFVKTTGIVDYAQVAKAMANVIAAAGLQADRIARLCGVDVDFRIVPFRGEYYRLGSDKDRIVNHLIYPIPDPELPFLGVHLTRMIGGYVTVGPNAVLAFAREGYGFGSVSLRDLRVMATFSGFRRVIRDNLKSGALEMANSLLKSRYLALCRRYCPELELSDLSPY